MDGWQAEVEREERFVAPASRLRSPMAECNAALAEWVRSHSYLRPVPMEEGESAMALMLLWEVDHRRPFPRQGGAQATPASSGGWCLGSSRPRSGAMAAMEGSAQAPFPWTPGVPPHALVREGPASRPHTAPGVV